MNILENVPLAPLTHYRIGGPARWLARPESSEDLRALARFLRESGAPFAVLGAGSNVLVDDAGFDGLVIHTSKLAATLAEKEGPLLIAGAGLAVIRLLRHCMKRGIGGLEFLAGVPGSVGGALFMNAGTKLGEAKDAVTEISVFDLATGAERAVRGAGLAYAYRRNLFLKPGEIILHGTFRGRSEEPETVRKRVASLLEARKRTQPIDKPSCGSVFRNPDAGKGIFAGKLIDEAGLRGHRVGNAEISALHANFIVNLGGATASDVRTLIDEAKKRVFERAGIALEEEVRYLGPGSGARI